MVEYTDDDVTRLASMIRGTEPSTFETCARHLLERGVTPPPPPPPDPADVVAEHIWCGVLFASAEWLPDETTAQANLVAAVRDLFTTDALKAAAAKVQEAEG